MSTANIRQRFSQDDRQAIREATARAEARSTGEVVCQVVERCDDYAEVVREAALCGAVSAALAAAVLYFAGSFWGQHLAWWIALPPACGAVLGWALARYVPSLQRRLIDPETLDRRLAHRAATAFVEEEIFATEKRTGVLIFLALFERRVLILADKGLEGLVPDAAWETIAERLAQGLRDPRPAQALITAIDTCGELMAAHGGEQVARDVNELDDELRMGSD